MESPIECQNGHFISTCSTYFPPRLQVDYTSSANSEAGQSGINILESNSDPDKSENNNSHNLIPIINAETPHTQKLTDALLELIFDFLNYGDSMASRRVCRRWDKIICESDQFLMSTIISLTLECQNVDMVSKSGVSWRQVRLRYFDFDNQQNLSIEETFNPQWTFFENIVRLEFHECSVSWVSVQRFIDRCPLVEELVITRCILRESNMRLENRNRLTLCERQACKRVLSSVRLFAMCEVTQISAISDCILKLISNFATNIQTLKISYCSFRTPVTFPEDMKTFFTTLLQFLELNSHTLKHLILDIRSTELLNRFCPYVLSPLLMSKHRLKLEVFKLTPPYTQCGSFGISQDSGRSLTVFLAFLNGQRKLKSLAFPHFSNLTSSENRRIHILDNVQPTLEKLRVPGQIYLRKNFLKVFTNLKLLFIGEKCGVGKGAMLSPTRFNFDVRGGIARKSCKKFRHLSACSKVNYESGKLFHIIEKFPNLSCFDFDGMKPVINDRDLQAIIKLLPMLRSISISSCDLITDYGITGIPIKICMDMNRLSTIYKESENIVREKISYSRECISSLKGLQKLQLFGHSRISDVGISLGFRFLEMKILHLPWNERITEWGILQIGQNNPSLETLNMTAALASTSMLGFSELIQSHPRIRRRQCRVNTINMYQEDTLSSPSLLTAVLWDDAHLV